MKGFNLVQTAREVFNLCSGEICERHIEVYQSKRSEKSFRVITTDIVNGEQSQRIEKGNITFVRCCLTSALGDNWRRNWGLIMKL